MLIPGDLGFPGLALVFLFFVGPVLGLTIRWKWRKAVGRKREIMRLMAMASEEAARAELEAAAELGAVAVARQSQCAVCYSPTTTRCSRCKAVHYCSGKCQIIHWRQGHKDDCLPPQFNDLRCNSSPKIVCNIDERLHVNQSESRGKLSAPSAESLNEEKGFTSPKSKYFPNDEIHHYTNVKHASELASGADPVFSDLDKVEESQSLNIAAKEHNKTADVNRQDEIKSSCSEFISSDSSVGSSHLNTSKQTFQSSVAEVLNGGSSASSGVNVVHSCVVSEPPKDKRGFAEGAPDSTVSKDKCDTSLVNAASSSSLCKDTESGGEVLASSKSSLQFSFDQLNNVVPNSRSRVDEPGSTILSNTSTSISDGKVSYDTSLSNETLITNTTSDYNFQNLNIKTSASLDDGNDSSQPLKPERTRSSSYGAVDYIKLSVNGGHPDFHIKLSENVGAHKVPPASSEIASSVPCDSNSGKTSVSKVQQLKAYKLPNHCSPGFIDISKRYNHKMLFPYESFIKLYHWNKVKLRPCGLVNCGNSCYANVVLQCLAFTRPLTAYLLEGLHSKACLKKKGCFTCEFESLVMKAKEEKSPVSPAGILSNFETIGSHLSHGREEDAHEFLRYAIDAMQSVCLKEAGETAVGTSAEETTLVGLMFGGYLKSKIKCAKCHGKSEHHERMMDLTVEIQGDISTLEEALEQFTAEELLDGENKYYCSRCKSYEKAKKKLSVLEAPNILTIALKRFQTGKFGKLKKSVQFPEILDMAPYISETNDKSPIYRLYAVIVHLDVMNATFSGHYVCYVRSIQGNWFKLDDSMVKPVELENVLSKEAYMLFYARCSPRAPSSIRNSILCNDLKSKSSRRFLEAYHIGKHAPPRTISGIVLPRNGISSELRRLEDLPYWTSFEGHQRYESLDSFERMFHSMHRNQKTDSSSDNSSLLSCSDEGSCSTESTRDSSSTDDFSDYVFGEAGRTLTFRDFDGSSSPSFSRPSQFTASEMPQDFPETSGYPRSGVEADCLLTGESHEGSGAQSLQDEGSLPILNSDTSKHYRNLTRVFSYNNSSRETSVKKLEHCSKPLDMKSGVHLRRPTKDRTDEPFY